MIKKIISVIAALALCAPLAVHAEEHHHAEHSESAGGRLISYGDAVLEHHSGKFTICGLDKLDSETKAVILAGYDENGVLVGAQYLKVEHDECAGHEIGGASVYKMARITNFSTDFVKLNIVNDYTKSIPTETPAATEAPEITAAPTATAAPDETHYPPYVVPPPGPPYERSLDAYHTFSVIKSVSAAASDDGEEYLVEVLRQGAKETLHVPTDVSIVASSDYYSDMTGADASALKEGDIVYFDRNNAGTKITQMAFIYRPVTENIITSTENYGTDFEHLFSANGRVFGSPAKDPGTVIRYGASLGNSRYQYAFGAVLDKGGGYFTLINRSGVADNAIEISTTADTIVYTVDMSVRRDKTGITNPSGITKSSIPRSAYDEDGNIEFSDEYSYAYAYARVINGVATEVVIYTGYGA